MPISWLTCLRLSKWCLTNRRWNCTSATTTRCMEELKTRGVLRVTGDQVTQFMQGLITNDMKHLEEGTSKSMYTMFLNSKGRVMYDAIIYKDGETSDLYVECDSNVVAALEKHLKMFKVKRKIDISLVDKCQVWVVFPTISGNGLAKSVSQIDLSHEQNNSELIDCFSRDSLCVSTDPRLSALGVRILSNVNVDSVAESKGIKVGSSNLSYRTLRYWLGVAEGSEELPYGKCTPLEMNCDYLHGVSFHKGCYIGQELTARSYHTGVIRKRVMPIYLEESTVQYGERFGVDAPIESVDQPAKVVGKLRGIDGNVAIGLLRISDALNASKLRVGHMTGYTVKPHWWPKEAPKDMSNVTKKRE